MQLQVQEAKGKPAEGPYRFAELSLMKTLPILKDTPS
jgi:hypothetical protein